MRNTKCKICSKFNVTVHKGMPRRNQVCYVCRGAAMRERRELEKVNMIPSTTEEISIDLNRICVTRLGTFSERLEMAMDYVNNVAHFERE